MKTDVADDSGDGDGYYEMSGKTYIRQSEVLERH